MALLDLGQASDHDADHADAKHRFTMIEAHFIVAAQPARFVEPAKGSFYDPALGQDFEAFDPIATPHDLQLELAKRPEGFDPLHQGSQIAAVGPNDLQPPRHFDQSLDQTLGGVPVLHGGAGDLNRQNQSQDVHRQVPFAAFDFFPRVVAAFPGLVGRLDRLTVHDGGGWRDLASLGFSQPVPQGVVDKGPGPVLAPTPKVTIDGLPGRKVSGQEPPGAAGSNPIEDRIDQDTPVQGGPAAFAFARFSGRDQRLDLVPFFISQIRWITSWMRLHPPHLY